MRLLHTGDWHIGKRLYGAERLDEIAAVLDEIAAIARTEEVDAILVAGDNLDRRLVEPAILATCLRGFEALAEIAPVVAVTGNHEDPLFWAEIAPYLAPRILLAASDAVFAIETGSGRLVVGCVPWPEPADATTPSGAGRGASREAYAILVRSRLLAVAEEVAERRRSGGDTTVLLAHLMVDHGISGGGEREFTLGGMYAIDGGAFPDGFDYIALGHLHRAQPLPGLRGAGRYSGSPLALDFSGDGVNPSVTIVDVDHGNTTVREVPVTAGRRLVRLRGSLDELSALAAEHDSAWFFCEVTETETRLDLARAVRERVPETLRVEQIGVAPPTMPDPSDAALAARDLPSVYADWLRSIGRTADPRLVAAFRDAVAAADRDRD